MKLNRLLSFGTTYGVVGFIYAYFALMGRWVLASGSDPMTYLIPAAWGSTYLGFEFGDRILMLSLLRWFLIFFPDPFFAGALFNLVVNLLILGIAMWWAYQTAGFFGALFSGLFLLTSFSFLTWATYLYPDPLVALLVLWACYLFFYPTQCNQVPSSRRLVFIGIVACAAAFTKATGASVIFLITFFLFQGKRTYKCLYFFLGILIGLLLTHSLFIMSFSKSDLINVYTHFLTSRMAWLGKEKTNLVSYLDLLANSRFFPLSVAAIICASAYKNIISKYQFISAFVCFGFVSCIYILTKRGGSAINTYVYMIFPLLACGLGAHLGSIFEKMKTTTAQKKALLLCLCGILVCFGFLVGERYPAWPEASSANLYNSPVGIFNQKTEIIYPDLVRLLYNVGPLLLVFFLLSNEIKPRPIKILGIIMSTCLWGGAFTAGTSKKYWDQAIKMSQDRIKAAEVVSKIPYEKITVYIPDWNNKNINFYSCYLVKKSILKNQKSLKQFLDKNKVSQITGEEALKNFTQNHDKESVLLFKTKDLNLIQNLIPRKDFKISKTKSKSFLLLSQNH